MQPTRVALTPSFLPRSRQREACVEKKSVLTTTGARGYSNSVAWCACAPHLSLFTPACCQVQAPASSTHSSTPSSTPLQLQCPSPFPWTSSSVPTLLYASSYPWLPLVCRCPSSASPCPSSPLDVRDRAFQPPRFPLQRRLTCFASVFWCAERRGRGER